MISFTAGGDGKLVAESVVGGGWGVMPHSQSFCIGMSMSMLLLEAGVSKGAAKNDREHVDLWMGSMRLKTSWLTNNS